MNGSDLESKYQLATDDILELIEGNVGKNIAVIIMTGGTETWHTSQYDLSEIDTESIQIWRITDKKMKHLRTRALSSMGDSKTLEFFLNYGMNKFPADHYGLVFWGHGEGGVNGILADQNYFSDSLYLTELNEALSNNYSLYSKKYNFIGFDTCLSANLETSLIISNYTDYLLASETNSPSHGWNYIKLINHLTTDKDYNAIDIASSIMDSYSVQSNEYISNTLSLIDLQSTKQIKRSIENFINEIKKDGYSEEDIGFLYEATLIGATDKDGLVENNMVDIILYANFFEDKYPNLADQLREATRNSIIMSYSNIPQLSGLSMNISKGYNYIPYIIENKDQFTMKE